MKRFFNIFLSAVMSASALLLAGCAQEELPDNRETEFGYVQFKLYKEASYDNVVSKAIVSQLDSLSQASKIRVELMDGNGNQISQTLVLTSSSNEAAEFGLRSELLQLVKGEYQVLSYLLYDSLDEELYRPRSVSGTLTVTPGGLTVFDLTANVKPRGSVLFTLTKDLSAFTQKPATKSSEFGRQYTFDEIRYIDLTLRNEALLDEPVTVKDLEVSYGEHFRDDEHFGGDTYEEENYPDKTMGAGYQTASSICDSLIYLNAGDYRVTGYVTYDVDHVLLERRTFEDAEITASTVFTVKDNETTDVDVPVTLYEADEYMKDNYALYEIWKALDGEHWSYEGESFPKGSNWNFNKDPDMWHNQPGVQIHANSRIASIDLSGFGINGELPGAIGQFTELVQLALGNHNELNQYLPGSEYDEAFPINGSSAEKIEWGKAKYSKMASSLYPSAQMSPACALALRLNGKTSAAARMYEDMSTDEIARMAAGVKFPTDYQLQPYDMNHGKLTNNLTKISDDIGKLTKLETLTIANAPLTTLPGKDVMKNLVALTDFELYNCPNLETLPEGVAALPSLVTVNISTNKFDNASDANDALKKIATGSSKDKIQILYFLQNNLTVLPVEVGAMSALGMLNVTDNNIGGTLQSMPDFAPEEIHLDYNEISSVPDDFCSLDNLTSFSIGHNNLTEFPNIFSADHDYIMSGIDVSFNKITALPTDFKGFRTKTLTLSGNPIDTYPKEIASTDSYVEEIVMQQCGLSSFPEDCLESEYSSSITVIDLQYNKLTDLPSDFGRKTVPSLYGLDLNCNSFSKFPYEPLYLMGLTAFSIRGQRNSDGERCLSTWPNQLYTNTGLRGFYIGSNNLGVIDDTISELIFYLDISDNPGITFDASDICSYWQAGVYNLFYDRTQEIIGCDAMTE